MKKAKAKPIEKHNPRATKGMFWHVHHSVLAEWCYDAPKRRFCIRRFKPDEEVRIRLQRLKPIDMTQAPQWLKRAVNNSLTYCDLNRVMAEHKGSLERLHRKQCKNCPWDGETLFPWWSIPFCTK